MTSFAPCSCSRHLTDVQLDMLCADGSIETFPAGPLCVEGEPASCFYVMLEGELIMSKRSGGVDIQTGQTSQRGVYFGAWSAYVPGEEHIYEASVRLTKPSRCFVLDSNAFARFMQTQFPMAVHLLEGHKVGGRRQSQIIGQREKLLALGTITAGLTHQLNNPAAATARAVADLREGVGHMRHKLAMVAEGQVHARGVARPGQHPGPGRRAGGQEQGSGTLRPRGVRPRGPDSATGWRTTTSSAPGTTHRHS